MVKVATDDKYESIVKVFSIIGLTEKLVRKLIDNGQII